MEFFYDIIKSLKVQISPIPSNYDQVCFLVTIGVSWSKTKSTKMKENEHYVEKYLIFGFEKLGIFRQENPTSGF